MSFEKSNINSLKMYNMRFFSKQIYLSNRYQREKAQLEEQFQSGALAQQAMLAEKEVLAQRLKEEVNHILFMCKLLR